MTIKAKLDEIYYRVVQSKFFRVMNEFDRHIARNLRTDNIETRPASTNGLWCCILLPTILLIYSLQYKVSLLYRIMTCLSIGYFFYCMLFIVFISVSCLVLKENFYGGCGASATVSTLLLYAFLDQGLVFSFIFSFISLLLFSEALIRSLTMFPKTFTIGEAMVVVQGIMLFLVSAFMRMYYYNSADRSDDEMDFVFNVVMTVLSSVGIIVTALRLMEEEQKTLQVICNVLSCTGVYALVLLHGLVGVDCLVTIVAYVFFDAARIQLFFLWACLTALAGVTISMRMKMAIKANTTTRKVFHILASAVFLTGIVADVHFMTLAAGCGLGVIVLVEAFRKSNVEVITPILQDAFEVYSDEQDMGYFAMTPIYLYVGLACPLVLVPVHRGYELELLSGVLSLGIGDTAASWFGSKYGFNKWCGGRKTFEGTVFNILSQIMTVYVLELFGLLNVENSLIRIIVSATITGLVEARTQQIDNLILPLLSILSFQTVRIMGYVL